MMITKRALAKGAVGLLAAATMAVAGPTDIAEARARCSHGNGLAFSFDHSHEGGAVQWFWLDHWNNANGQHVNRMITARGTLDIAFC
jgi:hypothetical protein